MARDKVKSKKKVRKNIAAGVAHVNSSFNNTKILISDVQGNAISWSSAGTMGFKGSRKSTPYAAQMAAEDAGKKAQDHGVKTLEVEVQGPHCALWLPLVSKSRRSATLRQWPTMAAAHQSAAASKLPTFVRAPVFRGARTSHINLECSIFLDMNTERAWRRHI